MCGITGIINTSNKLVTEYNSFIKDAIIAGAVRGTDSVGIGQIDSKLKRRLYKDVTNPLSFIESNKAATLINDTDDAYFTVVHHRAATVGKVSVDAAQPFANWDTQGHKYQPLTVHNGTLRNHTLYDTNTKTSFASDSEWLAWTIARNVDSEEGMLRAKDVFSSLTGAFSVVTAVNGRVYMANNGERPMTVAFTADGTGLLFSSEAGMLFWLAERNKIKLKDNKIIQLAKNRIYVFDFLEKANELIMTTEDFTPAALPTSSSSSSYTGGYSYTGGGRYYDLRRTQMDTLYKELTGSDPVDVNATEASETTPSPPPAPTGTGSKVVELTPRSAPMSELNAELSLKGKTIDFVLTQFDATSNTAYGTGWSADHVTRHVADAEAILNQGNVMIDVLPELESAVLSSTSSTVFTGKVRAIRWVSETVNGKVERVPYMFLDSKSVGLCPEVTEVPNLGCPC